MTSQNLDFRPDWVSPPGDTIRDILRDQNRSEEWLAAQLGATSLRLSKLLNGKQAITQDIATNLANHLGASEDFWLERDRQFRRDCKRLGLSPSVDIVDNWIESLPTDDMVKLRWITPSTSRTEKIRKCLEFFGVTSVTEWEAKYLPTLESVAYRKSKAFSSRDAAILAWLRKGELEANFASTTWQPNRVRELIPRFRQLSTYRNPQDFLPELRSLCSECGITLSITPTPRGCPASGATFIREAGDAFLLLSLRHRTDDHFWFSFFHEVGHLLLHSHLGLVIEDTQNISTEEENEADAFSVYSLIPEIYHAELSILPANRWAIVRFARKIGISPGVIVGQMQHSGRIQYSQFNYLKRRYEWSP